MRRLTSACIAVAISLFMAPPAHAAQEEDFDPNHPERMTVTPDISYKIYSRIDSSGKYIAIIFAKNNTVWVSPIFDGLWGEVIRHYNPSKSYWIKGVLNDNDIIIPAGSLIGENILMEDWHETPQAPEKFYLQPMVKTKDENGTDVWNIDNTVSQIIFTITQQGDIILKNSNSTHGIGYSTQYAYIGGGDIPEIISEMYLTPSDIEATIPPSNLSVIDYQLTYDAPVPEYWDNRFDSERKRIGKRVRAVFYDNDVYFQGCSYGNPFGWIKGRIIGDNIIFSNGLLSTVTTQSSYHSYSPGTLECLYAADYIKDSSYMSGGDTSHGTSTYYYKYFPNNKDLILNYNPTTGVISGIEKIFVFVSGIDDYWKYEMETWEGEIWDPQPGKQNIYSNPVFSKIPKGAQIPQKPIINKDNTIHGSYYDTSGNVMVLENLFYRIYENGDAVTFYKASPKSLWFDYPSTNVPFICLNPCEEFPDFDEYFSFPFKSYSDGAEVTAELVYYQDGAEHSSSGVGSVTDDSTPGDAVAPVYDLAGRKVSPDNLRPGIYIRGNQKIIVR